MEPRKLSYDVLVIGGGPAGIAAACEAAASGARVGMVEGSPWLGGQIWKDTPQHPTRGQGRRWLKRLSHTNVTPLLDTRVVGQADGRGLLAEGPDEALILDAAHLILVTGAREQFIPFPGWTLPGVTGAGGLQSLAKSGWPVSGKRVVVAGSGPLLLAVAAEMRNQGAQVLALVEQTSWSCLRAFALAAARHPSKMAQGVGLGGRLLGIPLLAGWWPTEAHGEDRLERVTLGNGSSTRSLECDVLACAFGLIPNDELPRLLEVDGAAGRVTVDTLQRTSTPRIFAAGELTGITGVEGAIVEGQIAGLAATGQEPQALKLRNRRDRWRHFGDQLEHAFRPRAELAQLADDTTIVCRCEDVTFGDLKKRADSREARLQCRCGMGHCQGRVCGDINRFLFGWEAGTVRTPLTPARFTTMQTRRTTEGETHDV